MSLNNENIALGSKISKVRNTLGLTLRQLSENIGLSASMLSQIETGRVSPSLPTLRLLANALNVPLFTFFIEDTPTQSLIVRSGQGKKITTPGVGEYTLLTPDLSGNIEMAILEVEPQQFSSEYLFAHNGEEVAYVSSGQLILHLEDDSILLNTGDSIKILPNTMHRWENPDKETANLIFSVTPPSF